MIDGSNILSFIPMPFVDFLNDVIKVLGLFYAFIPSSQLTTL